MNKNNFSPRLEVIATKINGILWEADAETFAFTYVSPQSKNILGYPPKAWYESPAFWKDHIHPEDRDEAVSYCHSKTSDLQDHEFEYRMIHANGDIVWIKDIVTVETRKDGSSVLTGIMIDVTENHLDRIEQADILQKSYQLAGIGHWELNLLSEELMWSAEVKNLHEVDQMYQPNVESAINFYPEGKHRTTIQNAVNEAIEFGKAYDLELKIVTAKGNEKWIRTTGDTKKEKGKSIKLYGTTQDITKRKEAEIQLQNTKKQYQSILEKSTILFYRHDTDHNLTYLSPQAKQFLGVDPEKEAVKSWMEFLTDHPANVEGIKRTEQAIETGEVQPPFEIEIRKRSGECIWVKVNEAPVIENGEVIAIVGSLTDITHQRKNEREIEKLSRVARETQNIVIITDPKERIQWVNKAFEEVTGYTLAEVIGKKPGKLLQGEKTSKETVRRVAEQVAEEHRFTERILNYSKDGTPYWVQMNVTPIKNEEGEVTEFFSIQEVVTEMVESEKRNEVLLQEIHHRVKNNLAIVSGMLSLEMEEFESEKAKLSFQRSINRIHSIAKVHELLYGNEDLSSLNIGQYIDELTSIIKTTFAHGQDVEIDIDVVDVNMNINVAIPFGMLMNELITNSFKYAFGDSPGKISIKIVEDDTGYHVVYWDNGRGMTKKPNLGEADTLGFIIIDTLLNQLKANFELDVQNKFKINFSFKSKNRGAYSNL